MTSPFKKIQNKPLIGITIGDINGIGPEIIIKALEDQHITKNFTPVIYSSARIISFYRKLVKSEFNYHQVRSLDEVHPRKINILNIWDEMVELKPGTENEDGSKYAKLSLEKATDDLISGQLAALVTAPISKHYMQKQGFEFPGHTEYFTHRAGVKESIMLLISDRLKVGTLTGHIAIEDVSKNITKESLQGKLSVMIQSMKNDFGIARPRIAVLGLNPHAGENGSIGKEENEVIIPVIKEMKEKGNLIFGPFAADGFFGAGQFTKYDAVLGMYHDQVLIPFKLLSFSSGVNFTAGLPIIRTSPDHGTGFSIAGKGEAEFTSMLSALFLAFDILKHRYPSEFDSE